MDTTTGLLSVATVIALVTVAKQTFPAVSGRWSTLLAVVLGVVIGIGEHVFTATEAITASGIYGAGAAGLLVGLGASGVYDISQNMGSKETIAVPVETELLAITDEGDDSEETQVLMG